MTSNPLAALTALSARIGQDINLVQAGGGNTSFKDGATLWIKASGKWLVNAGHDDMFVPVPLADIRHNLSTGEERFPEYRTHSGSSLRPSVETTMHAVLPQRVVIHVHSVAALSWAAQLRGAEAIDSRLAGLRWAWIPYIHPGVPLAQRIADELYSRPEVLILQNHGLVVAAEEFEDAERLLLTVEERLNSAPRPAPAPDLESLRHLARGTEWKVPPDGEAHALGSDRTSFAIATAGTMYPDHCVYLGPAAAGLPDGALERQAMSRALASYQAEHDYQPAFLLVEGKGILATDRLSRAARELLICLTRVVQRIPSRNAAAYLEPWQVAMLMNWDAEKYRLAMARKEE